MVNYWLIWLDYRFDILQRHQSECRRSNSNDPSRRHNKTSQSSCPQCGVLSAKFRSSFWWTYSVCAWWWAVLVDRHLWDGNRSTDQCSSGHRDERDCHSIGDRQFGSFRGPQGSWPILWSCDKDHTPNVSIGRRHYFMDLHLPAFIGERGGKSYRSGLKWKHREVSGDGCDYVSSKWPTR